MDITKLRALATTIASGVYAARSRFRNVDGYQYGTDRDMYEALGYPRVITLEQYASKYYRGDIAARIVEAFPEETWRGGAEVVETDDVEKETEFEKQFAALATRLDLWTVMQRVDILAGIGEYAVLLIGAPGEFSEPLSRVRGEGDISYLTPFTQAQATVVELIDDKKDPRYGLPKFYSIMRGNASRVGTSAATIADRVHWSRVIHVAETLDDPIYGLPRLERVWNRLMDLDKIAGGGAEAFWKRADQGMQLDLDPEMAVEQSELDALDAQLDEYKHGARRIIKSRGMTIKPLGSDVADIKGPSDAIIAIISAATGIPQRVLMGSEQAKLAAEQDSIRFFRKVEARRVGYAERVMLRPFVQRMIDCGAVPQPQEVIVQWSQIRTKDDEEKLGLAQKAALVNQTAGVEVIEWNEIRERYLDMDPRDELETPEEPEAPEPDEQEEALTRALMKGGPDLEDRILRALTGGSTVTVRMGNKRLVRNDEGELIGVEDAE